MLNISVNEFKKNIGFYLNKIKHGETLVIKEKDLPVAKIVPEKKSNNKRPVGLADGDFIVPDDFDSPLPQETQELFEK